MPSNFGIVGYWSGRLFSKEGNKDQTSGCKLTFHSAKLRIKRCIQADLPVPLEPA